MKNFGSKPWLLPQPVLIIGTYDSQHRPNAMNAAWGGQWDTNEVMISLGRHATTDNMKLNPYFTLTFATVDTLVAADYVGLVSGRQVSDKIEHTGWTVVQAPHVDAPLFVDFPLTLECRVKERIGEEESGFNLIGEIVDTIVTDDSCLADDGKPDLTRLNLIVFDPIHHGYLRIGEKVGQAFADGRRLTAK